jgi:hypothetical protein
MIALRDNIIARQPDNDQYTDITFTAGMVHVPDPFDRLSNLTVNTYDVFIDDPPLGTQSWWKFKQTGVIIDDFLLSE